MHFGLFAYSNVAIVTKIGIQVSTFSKIVVSWNRRMAEVAGNDTLCLVPYVLFLTPCSVRARPSGSSVSDRRQVISVSLESFPCLRGRTNAIKAFFLCCAVHMLQQEYLASTADSRSTKRGFFRPSTQEGKWTHQCLQHMLFEFACRNEIRGDNRWMPFTNLNPGVLWVI